MPLSSILALRPANAARQLGPGSTVPLLGLRQVLAVMMSARKPLWLAVVESGAEAEAVLRAAAYRQAVVGLCLWPGDCPPFELRYRYSPAAFFESVRRAAQAVENCAPFVLHAQLPVAESVALAALEAYAAACVDAGFTSLGVSPGQAGGEAALAALAPAQEFELGTMLLAHGVEGWQETFSLAGYRPEVLLGEQAVPQVAEGCACGWASRSQRPPESVRADVVMGPVEKAASPQANEALAYSEALRYLQAYALSGSADYLRQVFSSP